MSTKRFWLLLTTLHVTPKQFLLAINKQRSQPKLFLKMLSFIMDFRLTYTVIKHKTSKVMSLKNCVG